MKESLKVLQECAEVQVKKSNDYQNEYSRIRHAVYYPLVLHTLVALVTANVLVMQSVYGAS